jgi:hypothetical protein
MIAEGFITAQLFERLRETALAIFARGQEVAARQGLILVDTKYEFGMDENDALVLIDEIHTPKPQTSNAAAHGRFVLWGNAARLDESRQERRSHTE